VWQGLRFAGGVVIASGVVFVLQSLGVMTRDQTVR
jgi:hypothetical protein